MKKLKKLKRIRIHHEGTDTLIISAILLIALNAALYCYIESKWPFLLVAPVSIVAWLLLLNFFRCPIRLFKGDTQQTVVASADGKIVCIEEVDEHEYFHDRRLLISIFMSPLNVHANWYPVDGVVKKVAHQKGRFQAAYLVPWPVVSSPMPRLVKTATSMSTWDSSSSVVVLTSICPLVPKCSSSWESAP